MNNNNTAEVCFIDFPFKLYCASILVNTLYVAFVLEPEIDWYFSLAMLHGFFNSLFFPLIIIYLAGKTINHRILPGRLSALLILIASSLPMIDTVHIRSTMTRFSWSVWHDLNWYAIKATIFSDSSYLMLISLLPAVMLLALVHFRKSTKSVNTFAGHNFIEYVGNAVLIILFFKLFFPVEYYQSDSRFTPRVEKATGQNMILNTLANGATAGFFSIPAAAANQTGRKFQPYSAAERAELTQLGLLPAYSENKNTPEPAYDRIVLLVFESLAMEYFHSYNQSIPKETTDFFDLLMSENPYSTNHYTSGTPTLNGLYAILCSRIPFIKGQTLSSGEKSLPHIFRSTTSGNSWFVRGVSKFYGGEHLIKKRLGFNQLIAYEELASEYPEPPLNAWGYRDDIVLERTLRLMKSEKEKKYLILASLIDQHQPPHYCGIERDRLPKAVADHPSPIIPSIYWANHLLRNFITSLELEGLLDERTLIVVTSDHYPLAGYGHKELVQASSYDTLGKIPLIFISKNHAPFAAFDKTKLSCQLDLAPTLCHLAGIEIPESFLGHNLLNPASPDRTMGFFNDTLILRNSSEEIAVDVKAPDIQNDAMTKWINNLFVTVPDRL